MSKNVCLEEREREMGGSPGVVVMGGDSWSEGCGFKSKHCILDGHSFSLICCKNCNVCLKETENKRKRGWEWPNLKGQIKIPRVFPCVKEFCLEESERERKDIKGLRIKLKTVFLICDLCSLPHFCLSFELCFT